MATNAAAHRSVEIHHDDLALLDLGLAAVEDKMLEACDSTVKVLRDASRHILSAGGKRVRPRLVLLSYLAAGGRDTEDVVPVAAALELVHTASVVHDDINDHGVVRRGKPSVNAIWGRTFALLTGDFLFTKVYELMAPFKDLNVTLADATVALVEGETLQAQAVKDNTYTRAAYMEIIARKTASLFKAGGMLGAQAAGARSAITDALGNYGFNVGLAFQIIDDILDMIRLQRSNRRRWLAMRSPRAGSRHVCWSRRQFGNLISCPTAQPRTNWSSWHNMWSTAITNGSAPQPNPSPST
jgi:octaprenyl-diphosphate synthase